MRNRPSRLPPLLALAALVSLSSPAATARAAPYFQEVTSAFGAQACSGTKQGCWTNYMRMTDIDGDGDLDIIYVNADGYFNKGPTAQPLVVYLNDGLGNFTLAPQLFDNYVGYVRQIAVGDVDGDGDLDVYIPSAWGDADVLLLSDGGDFVDHATTHLPGLHSTAGAARFVDVDDDGDLDLFVSNGWTTSAPQVAHLYLNDGMGHFSDASAQLPQMSGNQPIDFDVFDADGDFDLDLLIDLHSKKSLLWLNDGAGHFTDASAGIPAQTGLKYGPVACDVDGDGDLDLWFDNSGPGYTEQLLINDGAGHFTDETALRVTGNVGADDNGVTCVDVDGDGDLDAVVASLNNVERVLINDGTGHFTLLGGGFSAVTDATLWLEVGDVNGDGRLDVATAQGESNFIDRLYLGTTMVPVDTVAPRLRAVQAVSGPVSASATPLVHFAVSDNATTDEGPRLQQAWIHVSGPGGMVDVTATFMGGDMFRAVLPAAGQSGVTVSYAACAKDRQGNEGCSAMQTYAVDPVSTSASSSGGTGGSGGSVSSSVVSSSGVASSTSGSTGAGGAGGHGGAGGAGGVPNAGGAGGATGGTGGGSPTDPGGCGCAVPGESGGQATAGPLGLALAALANRRRRARRSRAAARLPEASRTRPWRPPARDVRPPLW